jgi:hypothetical protein
VAIEQPLNQEEEKPLKISIQELLAQTEEITSESDWS